MKKLTRRSFTAAGILAALGVGGVFAASSNLVGCVYGPPPESPEPDETEPDETEPDETEPDGYEPDENEAVGVYGPPEYFGISPEGDGEKDSESDDDEFDPADNELVDVYGPPPGE